MCGIAGIVGRDVQQAQQALDQMVAAMQHRGPDGSGSYASPAGLCLLGHRRLAVLDLSAAARQPMLSAHGRTVLVYNGECYNHAELRRRLAGRFDFKSESDTETILYALMERGTEALAELRAMFALAVWDEEGQALTLARDRFGIKPLYYALTSGGQLLFASEVRALLASGLIPRQLNQAALAEYLLYGFVGEPHTLIAGVRMLPPGAWLKFRARDGQVSRGQFFGGLTRPTREPGLTDRLCETFRDAVRSHLISDVPLGAFLSSGVDSSAIVAAMAQAGGADIRTLTVSFPDAPRYSEGDQAAAWAAKCGARHTDIPMTGNELLGLLPQAIAAQDQPTIDAVNTYVVARAARAAGLTVALSGLGGDELFGGYPVFRDVPRALRLRRVLGALAPPAGRVVARWWNPTHRRPAKLADVLTAPRNLPALYAARRRLFSPAQVAHLLPHLALPDPAPSGPLDGLAAWCEADAISLLDQSCYMRHQLLRDSDTMGMANALEIRVPFLDNEFVRVAWNIGAAARDGKRLLARALHELLPPDVADRPKRGFTMPFAPWMCGPVKTTVADRLQALPPLFATGFVQRLWRTFLAQPDAVGWSRPWALFVLAEYMQANRVTL